MSTLISQLPYAAILGVAVAQLGSCSRTRSSPAHLAHPVIMPLLAGAGFGAVWLTRRRPSPAS